MHRIRPLARLAPVILAAACGDPATADRGAAPKPGPASKQLLLGSWQADFPASWAISKDAFLKDTLRGAAAYPKDPAEREQAIHDEMQAFVGSMRLRLGADDQATMSVQGKDQSGKWQVLATDGRSMQVKLIGREYTFAFQSDDEVHMTNKGKKPTTIVWHR